jgi:hypothetical protein
MEELTTPNGKNMPKDFGKQLGHRPISTSPLPSKARWDNANQQPPI